MASLASSAAGSFASEVRRGLDEFLLDGDGANGAAATSGLTGRPTALTASPSLSHRQGPAAVPLTLDPASPLVASSNTEPWAGLIGATERPEDSLATDTPTVVLDAGHQQPKAVAGAAVLVGTVRPAATSGASSLEPSSFGGTISAAAEPPLCGVPSVAPGVSVGVSPSNEAASQCMDVGYPASLLGGSDRVAAATLQSDGIVLPAVIAISATVGSAGAVETSPPTQTVAAQTVAEAPATPGVRLTMGDLSSPGEVAAVTVTVSADQSSPAIEGSISPASSITKENRGLASCLAAEIEAPASSAAVDAPAPAVAALALEAPAPTTADEPVLTLSHSPGFAATAMKVPAAPAAVVVDLSPADAVKTVTAFTGSAAISATLAEVTNAVITHVETTKAPSSSSSVAEVIVDEACDEAHSSTSVPVATSQVLLRSPAPPRSSVAQHKSTRQPTRCGAADVTPPSTSASNHFSPAASVLFAYEIGSLESPVGTVGNAQLLTLPPQNSAPAPSTGINVANVAEPGYRGSIPCKVVPDAREASFAGYLEALEVPVEIAMRSKCESTEAPPPSAVVLTDESKSVAPHVACSSAPVPLSIGTTPTALMEPAAIALPQRPAAPLDESQVLAELMPSTEPAAAAAPVMPLGLCAPLSGPSPDASPLMPSTETAAVAAASLPQGLAAPFPSPPQNAPVDVEAVESLLAVPVVRSSLGGGAIPRESLLVQPAPAGPSGQSTHSAAPVSGSDSATISRMQGSFDGLAAVASTGAARISLPARTSAGDAAALEHAPAASTTTVHEAESDSAVSHYWWHVGIIATSIVVAGAAAAVVLTGGHRRRWF